jgi:uncharacterized repeat protein (TIGR01451 family)
MFSFSRSRKVARNRVTPIRPAVESLEDRCTPSCNVISGFVYQDANNNGIFDPGEQPIANSPIQLRNAANQVVGSTMTNAQGFYEFDHDATVSTAMASITRTVSFPSTETDFTLTKLLQQFDPALGELQSIDITHAGSITSEIKVENFSTSSPSTISATVGGDLTLVAPGVNHMLTLTQNAGSYSAQVYDGTIDFAGTSGSSFGSKTAQNSGSITLTGSALTPYIGTGTVGIQESSTATSNATGGGNLIAQVNSTGTATITVVYKFIPENCLDPGNYTIIQTQQPAGLLDGKDARGGTPLANSVGADTIAVVLGNADLPNNNFGEIAPARLSGFVWADASNDGLMGTGEARIPSTTVTLTGFSDLGPVSQTAATNASGFYEFTNLRPGVYTLSETQPAGFLDGRDAMGSQGGVMNNDQMSSISLAAGMNGQNNNFGELQPAGLSGFVYADADDDGVKEPGESPIPGVTVTLTGSDDLGAAVNIVATTDAAGFYRFQNLRPGTYTITETHPGGFIDGKDAIGSQGGTAGNDVMSAITLAAGVLGINNNFGEIKPESADLVIVKSVSAASVKVGQNLSYTLTISNVGPDTAKQVVVTDTLPTDATFVGAFGVGWNISQTGGVVTATRNTLAVNQPTTIVVTITAPAVSNTLVNEATVTSITPDPTPLNNKSTVSTPVVVNPPPIAPLATRLGAAATTSKRQLLTRGGATSTVTKQRMAFVDGVYQILLGRSPSKRELNVQVQRLQRGVARSAIVRQLFNSDAHFTFAARQLYTSFLHRVPSPLETAAAIQQLRGGGGEAALAQQLVTSAEYQAQFNTPSKLVGGLYLSLTGKLPDVSTHQSLVQSLDSQPLLQAVQSLMATQDGLRFTVDHVYRTVLRRRATAGETQFGALQLQTGATTQAELTIKLLASGAFYQLAWKSVR